MLIAIYMTMLIYSSSSSELAVVDSCHVTTAASSSCMCDMYNVRQLQKLLFNKIPNSLFHHMPPRGRCWCSWSYHLMFSMDSCTLFQPADMLWSHLVG